MIASSSSELISVLFASTLTSLEVLRAVIGKPAVGISSREEEAANDFIWQAFGWKNLEGLRLSEAVGFARPWTVSSLQCLYAASLPSTLETQTAILTRIVLHADAELVAGKHSTVQAKSETCCC